MMIIQINLNNLEGEYLYCGDVAIDMNKVLSSKFEEVSSVGIEVSSLLQIHKNNNTVALIQT